MLHDRCLCGNSLNEQDPDESIYCSVTCARQDALDSLSARDPRHSTSSLSSLSCPSLAGTDESCESEDGVWEWVTTPSPLQSSYRSHYQRVQSLRGESESGEGLSYLPARPERSASPSRLSTIVPWRGTDPSPRAILSGTRHQCPAYHLLVLARCLRSWKTWS
ncbi:hypothetical protein BS47DRAFT_1077193 [Hydnum rufescens UP504]|uniref:Uncharacterized protein n=1 Tax=Hydnum rufescens UP504 TaxID=1448309 RepID=A0A9P6B8W7_9AGAM|nr:hypothetical protein BS47DRAFT_1077193 [Hydnum rufescens UP504]